MSLEQREKLSAAKLGKPSARKGIPNKMKLVDSVSKFNQQNSDGPNLGGHQKCVIICI